MRVVAWNVNGLKSRAAAVHDLIRMTENPAALFLSEIKCKDARAALGTDCAYNIFADVGARSGHHGVALLLHPDHAAEQTWTSTRLWEAVSEAVFGPEAELTPELETMCAKEGRIVAAETERAVLVAVYVPNSGRGLKRLGLRTKWERFFASALAHLTETTGKPLIVGGDVNVVPRPCDVWHWPKVHNKKAGCCDAEQEGFAHTLAHCDLVDMGAFPEEEAEKGYTFWSAYGGGAAHRANKGWRLDTIMVSRGIAGEGDAYVVMKDFVTGDHAPISLTVSMDVM